MGLKRWRGGERHLLLFSLKKLKLNFSVKKKKRGLVINI